MLQGGTGESSSSSRKLHPFFTKVDVPSSFEEPSATDFSASPPVTAGSDGSAPENNHDESRRKRRKTTDANPGHEESEPKRQRRKRKSAEKSLTGAILNHLTKPRQPATTTAATEESAKKIPSPPLSEASSKPDDHGEAKEIPAADALSGDAQKSADQPAQQKRVLRFNPKTGKLGSPQRPKQLSYSPSRVVCIRYGRDADDQKRIGDMISGILDGTAQLALDPVGAAEIEKATTRTRTKTKTSATTTAAAAAAATTSATTSKPSKAIFTHPFFSRTNPDGSKADDSATRPSVQKSSKIFLSTPVSPRKPRSLITTAKAPRFGIRSAGAKVPGAKHPMFPAQGMSHVRGEEHSRSTPSVTSLSPTKRKSKGPTIVIAPPESLLGRITEAMGIENIRRTLVRDPASIEPAPTVLRLPRKHFESGPKLRSRIRSELQARFIDKPLYEDCDFSLDELSAPPASRAHPGIDWLYRSLETQLSAYDRSTCESIAWTQKYAPSNAAQVLQRGREAVLLRDWLQTLRVQSVESGSTLEDKIKDKVKGEGIPKKKRKKNKLDDFIVDDEYESDSMYEISDDDISDQENGPRHRARTIMRGGNLAPSGKTQKRLGNTVLLSGPHGCGKTAAVYAVANELDFEVFEINSSSRRSGKDILEKVGDMTRNHLVQHKRTDPAAIDPDEVADEIKSGKQGMMTAFFKPKETKKDTNEAASGKKGRKKSQQQQQQQQQSQNDEGADREGKTASGKPHKQSLILLEEVDILFEEDKQFWTTLTGLIAQSKRPFIMTCNNEKLVPTQILDLHGIFRFSPVPSRLATDTCLLIAANEGHALQRSAVEALYHSRGDDLRAAITELNYWCQIGVGDRRGGFDWLYLRWPKGCDLDEDGNVVRVVSQDTYCEGMGWLSRDEIATAPDPLGAEEEAMRQCWDHWQCDVADWGDVDEVRSWAACAHQPPKQPEVRPSLLAALDSFCSAMSDADLCSSQAYATQLHEVIDPTLPDLPAPRRDDFIIGQTLLDAQPVTVQTSTHKAISTTLQSLARATVSTTSTKPGSPGKSPPPLLQPLNEQRTTSILSRSFQTPLSHLIRYDIALAFDPIAVSPKGAPLSHLDPSVFDRPLGPIILDVAPWVRAIVLHDHLLMQRRMKLSNLLNDSDGGGNGGGTKRKRMRNTRSALSALEGGERSAIKRDKWFGDALNLQCIMATAGHGWTELVAAEAQESVAASPTPDELA